MGTSKTHIEIVCGNCEHTTVVLVPEDLPVLWWECGPCGSRNAHIQFIPDEVFEAPPGSTLIVDGDDGFGIERN